MIAVGDSGRIHLAAVARTALGIALLTEPQGFIDAAAGERLERGRWRVAARVLGARHLVEALVINFRPAPALASIGAGIDGIHAGVATGLAVVDRDRRRLLMTNAIVALGFALAGAHHARALAAAPPD